MKTSNVKFKIDLKKLETVELVGIGKDLYAKKLADSIEIYEIKPVEITPEDKESISEAVKTFDKMDEIRNKANEIISEEIPPVIRFVWSLENKYCENCPKGEYDSNLDSECQDLYEKKKATCELSYLRFRDWTWAEDWFPFPNEIYNALKEEFMQVKMKRLKAGKRGD